MIYAHRVIENNGIKDARRMAATKAERMAIDAAWSTLHEEDNRVLLASRLCTTLPHKIADDLDDWQQTEGEFTYRWYPTPGSSGMPYGAKSRMILIHILHYALSVESSHVACGDTLYSWNTRLQSTSVGGMTYRITFEHGWRVLEANLSLVNSNGEVLEDWHRIATPTNLASSKLPTEIILKEDFFTHIQKNIVPIRYPALTLLRNNSSAIDLYIRLSDGLNKLDAPLLGEWPELKRRFGAGYKNIRQMKPAFNDTLSLVCAVYPQAKIEMDEDGIILYPSPPPVEMTGAISDLPLFS
jgi:replication initiator protein